MDKVQRKKLSIEEQNSIFLASTNVLHAINSLKEDRYVSLDMKELQEELELRDETEEVRRL